MTAELEMYVGLKLNHVPTEMLFYPEGDHDLKKPREAYLSQQSRVDWFNFWLNGEEEPGNEEQYVRWRKMREEWQAAK